MSIKPPALKKGDRIGIFSPSSTVTRKDIEPGIAILRERGFDVYVHPQTFARHRSAAGTECEKSAALHDLFTDKSIKAIFAAGGGNHALWLLPEPDYKIARKNPKIVMGFSDNTAILNAFNARADLTTFHGPVVKWLPRTEDPDHCFALLAGKKVIYPMNDAIVLHKGAAEGRLIGGNLTLVNYLAGTRYLPKMDGAILFVEDINEELSNLDRLFWRLRTIGILQKISGLVVGQITDPKDTGKRPYGFSVTEIIERNIAGLAIPVVMNAPFGHVDRFYTMPIGSPAKLNARGNKVSLALTEPAVSI